MEPGSHLVLYTEAHRLTGRVSGGIGRLSDWLNNPESEYVELMDATFQDLLATEGGAESSPRIVVSKPSIQIAVPMDQPSSGGAGVRVHTERLQVAAACPLFLITGDLHRRPTDPRQFTALLRSSARLYVPLSPAKIRYLPNGRFDGTVETALINSKQTRFWAQAAP